ncbi:Uncharacterised protein [Mycobacteroides abscessus subsp. abscessus]|nr:Uncharacterised protein [Mycobacteroides abscessus subsp. abscessus]
MLFNKLHCDFELCCFTCKVRCLVVFRESYINNFLFAFFHAHDTIFKTRNHATRTKYQFKVFSSTAFKLLAIYSAFKVKSYLHVLFRHAFGFYPRSTLLLKVFKHLFNVFVVHF